VYLQRTYSIASSPNRDNIELTIKCEKPYGYIPPRASKADGFAAYFFEQIKIGDKIHTKLNPNKDHFLSRIAAGMEKNIAYWSGANGTESARCLIQYMGDTRDPEFNLTLFYSNPALYASSEVQHNNTVNIIYYDWLINMAKKMENLKIVFTFTRQKELYVVSDHPRIVFRNGRFFSNSDGTEEKTLKISQSGFINGIVRGPDGKVYRGGGIMQNLMDIEGIRSEKIDKEQFYLQSVGAHH
jgi:hypothetical protein